MAAGNFHDEPIDPEWLPLDSSCDSIGCASLDSLGDGLLDFGLDDVF